MGTPHLSRCSQSYSRANEDDSGLAWTESKRGSELSKVSPEFGCGGDHDHQPYCIC